MALPTSNLRVSAIKAALGVATAKEIFYIGSTLKNTAQLGALVNKNGLNATYCPGADADARLANLLSARKLSYLKGYVATINYLSASPEYIGSGLGSFGYFAISSNITWSFTSNVNWLAFSQTSGTGDQQITVTALSENTDPLYSRTATITITGAGLTFETTVTQSAYGDIGN